MRRYRIRIGKSSTNCATLATISSGYACAQTARNALLTVCSDKIYVVGVVTELCETNQQVEIEWAWPGL